MKKILKILVITRGQEDRHIQPIIDRLRGEHGVAIIRANEIKLPWWYKILHQIEEYDFYYRRMKEQIPYYKERAFNSYPKWLQKIVRYIPNLGWLKRFYKPPRAIYNQLKELKPDLVIATSLMLLPEYEDFQYAVATKDLKIPLIGFAPTWDSLTTKTFINPIPDILFIWNPEHEQEALDYHRIPKQLWKFTKQDYPYTIKVGPYTLEKWLKPKIGMRRDKFCNKYNFDPKKSISTYVCSSPTIFGDETSLIEKLARDTNDQIIIQLHPNKPKNIALKETKYIKYSVTDSLDNYLNSETIYGINTSALLEASLCNKRIEIIGDFETQQSLHFKSLRENLRDHANFYFEPVSIEGWLWYNLLDLPSETIIKYINML